MHVSTARASYRLGSLAALALLAAGCADDSALPTAADQGPSLVVRSVATSARYIVEYEAGTRAPTAATIAAAGGTLVGQLPHLNAVVVANATSRMRLAALPNVKMVMPTAEATFGPVQRVRLAGLSKATPSGTDPSGALFYTNGTQWNMRVMRLNEVWAPSNGGLGVRACIIDSGIDATHQELQGKVLAQKSFLPNDNGTPQLVAIDSNFHGTHVASTVTGNGVLMASVAPDARLLIAKVFDAAGGGATTDRVLGAVKWCTDQRADVINMSLGFRDGLDRTVNADFIAFYQAGIDYATDRGVLVVASSGNDNRRLPHATNMWVPAELNGVLNVGATGPVTAEPAGFPNIIGTYDRKAFYSNYGTGTDVFAPGGRGNIPLFFLPRGQGDTRDNILAACASAFDPACAAGDNYVYSAGTSMAAPHVTGLAALLRGEITGPRAPGVGARLAECILESTADIGPASTFGGGRVDAAAAIVHLKSGGC